MSDDRLKKAAENIASEYEPGGSLDPAKIWPDGLSHGVCCDQMQQKLAAANERAEKAEKELRVLKMSANELAQECNQHEAENERLREAIKTCIDYANGRESEWGDRAIHCFEILEAALAAQEPQEGGDADAGSRS